MSWNRIKQETESIRNDSVARAFAISLMIHLFLLLAVEFGQEIELAKKLNKIPLIRNLIPEPIERVNNDVPLLFVDVDPTAASETSPENAKYYSDMSSIAANVETGETEKEDPNLFGEQENVPRAHDAIEMDPQPMQPSMESPEAAEANLDAAEAAPDQDADALDLSDMAAAQSSLLPRGSEERMTVESKDNPPRSRESRKRPRTLEEARQMNPEADISGAMMKQEAGVDRVSLIPSLDVANSPFGSYDRLFVTAVDNRWKQLLREHRYALGRSGKVVLDFRLTYEGKITHVKVAESTVGEVLGLMCKRAVLDPAPYRPWPSDMRRVIGGNYRDVRFTFYYN